MFLAVGAVHIILTTPQGAGAGGKNYEAVRIRFCISKRRTSGRRTERSSGAERRTNAHGSSPRKSRTTNPGWGFVRDPNGSLVGLMEKKR